MGIVTDIKMDYNKEDNNPILVQFENGPLRVEHRPNVELQYLRSTAPRSNKRLLVANCDGNLYSGNVNQKQSSGLIQYYVGIIDKHTQKIERIQKLQLCTLRPKMIDTGKDSESKDKKSYREETDRLTEAFGSAKQKRLVASRKRNVEVNETVSDKVGDVAKKIIQESPTSLNKDNGEEADEFQDVIPPMNRAATSPTEVFDINDIISREDYRFLLDNAKEMIHADDSTLLLWQTEQKYPAYISNALGRLREKKPVTRKVKG